MTKISIITGCILGGISLTSFLLWTTSVPKGREIPEHAPVVFVESVIVEPLTPIIEEEPLPEEQNLPASFLVPNVPFTVQAPLGQWQDPLYQDGCEEASLAMARAWIQGVVLTQAGVTEEIAQLSAFEKKQFGQAIDTSIQDTAWLLEQYYGIATGEVQRDITIDTIKRALISEKIVIVPTDGRKLKNPNFTQPGPARHMLVITGYESEKKEFVVNDPGTRKGEGYRYGEDVLYDAIIDYETGDHVPLTSTDKVMLVVGRGE